MRLLLSYFLISVQLLILSNAQELKFTVSLTEQNGDEGDSEYILLTADLNCALEKCNARVDIQNSAGDFYRVYMDGKLCINSVCLGSFVRHQTSNITISKPDYHIDIFDFQYESTPNIIVLGCQVGFYVDGICNQISTSDGPTSDTVCVCATDTTQYCDPQTNHGMCSAGTVSWWKPSISSSTSSTLTSSTVTTPAVFHEEASVSLSEEITNSQGQDKVIQVHATLECDSIQCTYGAEISNYASDYYTIRVDECYQSPCRGTFPLDQSMPVRVFRLQQHIELLKFENRKISVLGCDAGLLNEHECLRSLSSPKVGDSYYSDVVCSCLDAAGTCSDQTLVAKCTSGSTTWWIDDGDSTYATPPTNSLSTFPPSPTDSPISYDFSITIAEGVENEPTSQNNITVNAFLNCTQSACRYTISSFNPGEPYYSMTVNFAPCPASVCSGIFSRGDTIRTFLSRKGEILDLFDFYFDAATGEPNVMVLGCSSGLLNLHECQKVDYYDTKVQLHDVACICQSEKITCDGSTKPGSCTSPQQPVWWQQSEYSFNILLSEGTVGSNPNSEKNISLSTLFHCSQDSCVFKLEVDQFKGDYYAVQVGGNNCGDSCQGSMSKNDIVPITIFKQSQYLNIITLSYNNVKVLGCSRGLLEQNQCIKTSNLSGDVKDEICTCEGPSTGCTEPDGTCDGTPIWWQETSSFSVELRETDVNHPLDVHLTVSADVYSVDDYYAFKFTIYSPTDFFTVMMDQEICHEECSGKLSHTKRSVILSVHRLGEHINLIELQYIGELKVLIMDCQVREKNICWNGAKKNFPVANLNLTDSVCFCTGTGESCNDGNDRSSCLTWWSSDSSTSLPTSSPSTLSTTNYDLRNEFSMAVSMTESYKKRKSIGKMAITQKRHLSVISTMSCGISSCEYSMIIDNSAKDYFKVFVNSQLCPSDTCTGSFLQGKSVNVTVFRENQHVDLMDFEFTDKPRVVVLGCQDGLVKYQGCIRSTQTSSDAVNDYTDEVCSCRSSELSCDTETEDGVCTSGNQNWWKTNDATSPPTTITTPMIPTTSMPTDNLKELSDSGVGLNNVTQVLNATLPYSERGMRLNRTQIFEITKILHNSANLPGISAENAFQILQNMDNVLNAHQEEIRNSQNKEYRLLEVLRPMVRNTNSTMIQYLKGMNLGFGAKHVDCKSIDSDDGLIDYGPSKGFKFLNDTTSLDSTKLNSIIVPLTKICGDQGKSVSHVFFTIYRHQKLFSGPQQYRVYGGDSDNNDNENNDKRQSVIEQLNQQNDSLPISPPSKCDCQISLPYDSTVMSATVMNNDNTIRELSRAAESPIMAKLQFNLGKIPRPLHGDTIVSWFNTGNQEWDLEQQCTVLSDSDGILTAQCAHLTDFSALIYGQINAQYVCSYPLIVLGYVVNAFSIVCLMILIIISTLFYLRGATIKKILTYVRGQTPVSGDIINLTYYCAFFVFFIFLLFFMNQTDESDGDGGSTTTSCVVIAAISYFSLISAILMSTLIGIRMISHFFTPKLRKFFGLITSPPAALSIGLVVPFIFTLLIAIFDNGFFQRNDAFCWVRPDYIVYAVVIPIGLPIVNGLICSAFVIYKMFCQTKRGLANKETAHYDAEFWSKIFGLIIMQVAMGLPWGIEFIVIGLVGPSPWNYIFVILIGSQGIDLFLIFLYRRHRLLMDAKKWSARRHRFESAESKRTQARRAMTFMSHASYQ